MKQRNFIFCVALGFIFAALMAGQAIYGANIGPTTPVSAPTGALPTSLGGSSVTINGTPAPISYAGQFRLDVQVPFSVSRGSTAALQISSGAGASAVKSANVSVPVASAVPAIYTSGLTGVGPVSATNQDGSANTLLNPAPVTAPSGNQELVIYSNNVSSQKGATIYIK